MPVAPVGSAQLAWERRGSGPPLLLIMGMGGTRNTWGEDFVSALARDFEVITFDNRGVGESSRVRDPFTIRDLAADAAALLDLLVGDEPSHVLGVSMGGMVAQELALSWPAQIRTLSLGCTYCGGPESLRTSPAVSMRLARAMQSGDRERIVRVTWEVNVNSTTAADPELWARFRSLTLDRPVALPVITAQMQAIASHDTSPRLSTVSAPTLVIHGSADEMLPVHNAQVIAGLIRNARLEILDGGGHLFFWEQPTRSAALLRDHALGTTGGAEPGRPGTNPS